MKSFFRLILLISTQFTFSNSSFAQNIEDDYNRAVSFLWRNVNNKKAFNLNVRTNWFPDSTGFWYIIHRSDSKNFMKIDFENMKPESWFDQERLALLLNKELDVEIMPLDLPINNLRYIDKSKIEFKVKNERFVLDLNDPCML